MNGLQVCFSAPIKKEVSVETENVKQAVAFAIDLLSGRYPNKDWKTPKYKVFPCNMANDCKISNEPIFVKH